MSNRFDLEQQILECWKVTDDIRTVLEHGPDSDMQKNFEALARLTDLRFEKLWFIFEQMIANERKVPAYEKDDGPLSEDQIRQIKESVK